MTQTKTKKTGADRAAPSTPSTPAWMTDPHAAADAWREAMVGSLDGLISMHEEMRKGITQQLDGLRTERERLTETGAKAFDDVVESSFEASRKALGYMKDQVERMGRPQPEA